MTTREVKPGALAQLRAPVVALGRRDSVIHLAPARSDGIAAGSQPLRCKQRGCFIQSIIDLLAILLLALCVAAAPIVLLFLFLMFV